MSHAPLGDQSGWVWYELMTNDVAAAKSFYGTVVGWTTQDMPMPDMTYTVLQAADSGVAGILPLSSEMTSAGMKPCWVGYIHATDVDGAAARLKSLGGKIYREPTDIPNVGRFAVVADPQGAVFHLFKPGSSGSRTPSSDLGHIGWHELHTNDWLKAFDFYSAMFGWHRGDAIPMGAMGTYQLFTIKDLAVGAMFNSPGATAQCFWLYYFKVTDIDAAAARLTAGGGRLMHGPQQVPGDLWIIQATDPQGAWFALLGTRK
ncbi:MAG: VOC family protein [Pseudomonadota bacterium]|nr:VOC family protein [Pseudomonadota bacterium]